MQITNTQARPISLPGRGVKLDGGGIKLIKQGLGQVLVPGANFVDDQIWSEAKKNAGIKIWLGAGYLREGNVKLPPEELPAGFDLDGDGVHGAPPPENLSGLPREAIKVKVAETEDRSLLTKWADGESRKSVLDLLEKRLAELR